MQTRRHPRDDPGAEASKDVRVGDRIGPTEFQLYGAASGVKEPQVARIHNSPA